MSCLVRIENYYESFTTSERKIADYLLQNAETSVKMSIHELAAAVNVAPSSITRFARRLDYKSFSEMRIELARGIDANIISDFTEALEWSSDQNELTQHFIQNVAAVCTDVLSLNGMDKFRQAAAILKGTSSVYLFGVGASSLVVQDLQQKLLKLRKRCIFTMDGNLGIQNAITAGKGDVVLAVSYGGNTTEVTLAVRYAKENGATIIAITRYGQNALSELADLNLYIPTVEQITKIAAIFSRYAQLFMVDVIFLNLAQIEENDPVQMLEQYRSLWRPQER